MKLTLPFPPSANNYWRVFRGRILVSQEARAYKLRVAQECRVVPRGMLPKPFEGFVRVSVAVYRPARRGDLDNSLKVLLDALKGIAFVDDSQVIGLVAERFEDKLNPRVEVTVTEAA